MATILIIDDEKEICKALKGILSDEGYRILIAHSPEEATHIIASENPNLLLLDIWFGKGSWDGVYFLDRIQLAHPFMPIIMISGHATLSLAVSALQKGAYDFLEKPINVDRLLLSVKRALEFKTIQSRLITHREQGTWAWPLPIDGKLKKLAASDARILLLGERGVGKMRLAKYLHLLSPRHEGPLLVAGSVMLNALDDEGFFGVQSSGRLQKVGFFEHAQGGTVVLNNVHQLSPARQSALAQIFQSGTIKRLGGDQPIPLNARFIATALPEFMKHATGAPSSGQKNTEGSENGTKPIMGGLPSSGMNSHIDRSFYDRITLMPFTLESLRQNSTLIPLWAHALVQELAQEHDLPLPTLSQETLIHMQTFDWPGNMQQMYRVIETILIKHAVDTIRPEHLPHEILSGDVGALVHTLPLPQDVYALSLKEARACFEMSYVKAQLAASQGSVTKAAEVIGMERSALHRKLKNLSSRPHAPPKSSP